jgi:CcmD family protein
MIPYAVSIGYMIAGYAVIFVVLAAYLVSLFIRWQNLNRDLRTLEDMEKQQ